jgi:hypothetical protein
MSARNLVFRRVFEKYLPPEVLSACARPRTERPLMGNRPIHPLESELLQCTFPLGAFLRYLLTSARKNVARLTV